MLVALLHTYNNQIRHIEKQPSRNGTQPLNSIFCSTNEKKTFSFSALPIPPPTPSFIVVVHSFFTAAVFGLRQYTTYLWRILHYHRVCMTCEILHRSLRLFRLDTLPHRIFLRNNSTVIRLRKMKF